MSGLSPKIFAATVKQALEPLADATTAKPMAAYMRDQFEFLGIKSPVRRAATRALITAQNSNLVACAEALWAMPFREYQYVASDLLDRHAKLLAAQDFQGILKLVTQKSWWDTVDALDKPIGVLVMKFPDLIPRIEKLATHKNMWLRRAALQHQLHYKKNTNIERLFQMCLANARDPEFFIRKSIGWVLREASYHYPSEVRAFLKQHGSKFSPLTIREGSKRL